MVRKMRLLLAIHLLLVFLLPACQASQDPGSPGATATQVEPTLPPTAEPSPTPAPTLGPVPVEPVLGLPTGSGGFPWWNDAVFYEIFVRSFFDSDGDGIGDFAGIIEKMDYLNDGDPETTTDLGVTGIWLMPVFPSPSYHGYDTVDYYDVNPQYGTMEDFRRLLEEAHAHGIRVIIDLMLNHTSSEHPWFEAARDPGSEYHDWYIWSEADPAMIGPWGQRVWHLDPVSGQYFYGVFWEGMPDLNYANPEVVAEMQNVVRFWLEEVGVDGFRLDGARYVVEEGSNLADTPANHQFFAELNAYIKSLNPEAFIVGEVWTTSFAVVSYVKADELDMAFEFDLASAFLASAQRGTAERARNQMTLSNRMFPLGEYGVFLTNHDQERVMSQLGIEVERAKVAASLYLTAPGTPFIYYGEEIGMTGRKPDELIRTPMQWNAEPQAGFTTGQPWEPVNAFYAERNVANQDEDPDSLLNHYRQLVRLRNEHVALRTGAPLLVESGVDQVYALLRHSEDETLLVLINLGDEPVSDYNLSLSSGPLAGAYQAVTLLGEGDPAGFTANSRGGLDAYQPLPTLPAGSTVILQLHPAP